MDLEKRGYYLLDLKCSNLLLDKNRRLYVIDLGVGFTQGMYRPEAEENIVQGKVNGREMLYMLGRTVWQLWDDEFSPELVVPGGGTLPPVIDEMVQRVLFQRNRRNMDGRRYVGKISDNS